jgi:uncharacterized protein (TIGR03067 family)
MRDELNRLQGKWAIARLEVDGAAVPAGALQGAAITVANGRFTTVSMGAEYAGAIELDPNADPKTIAMHFDSGPEAGHTNYGIYEWQGSQWRLCLNMTGGPAPRRFETSAGSGCALETLARAAVEADPPARGGESAGEAVAELQGEWAMVSCMRAGQALPAPFLKSGRRAVDGIQTTLHFGPQLFMRGVLSRDAGGANFIKLEHTGGEGQGSTQLGIFELEGDALKTCFAAAGMARPAAYASSTAGGETFTVWKRVR